MLNLIGLVLVALRLMHRTLRVTVRLAVLLIVAGVWLTWHLVAAQRGGLRR